MPVIPPPPMPMDLPDLYLNEPRISCERAEEIDVFGHFQLAQCPPFINQTKLITITVKLRKSSFQQ